MSGPPPGSNGEVPAGIGSVPSANGGAAELVEHFFRHETGRLHGGLVRLLGVHNLTLAEDIAQEAMLRALHHWSMGGIPANPSAWITRVAMNLARDALRHQRMSGAKESAIVTHLEQTAPTPAVAMEGVQQIRDDALRLLFVCCHPSVAADAQVILALKVLCGFSTGEIAHAFLMSEAAIEKQLTRTKQRIQKANLPFELPEGEDLGQRLNGVLAALYLLFNEGYKASAGDRLLREDLCEEAIRLTSLLVAHPAGRTPRSHALLALMLLSAARFPTRVNEEGNLLRLDGQDRSKWDQQRIAQGLVQLSLAAEGEDVSEYHLQAGIAALHCTAADYASTDWERIVQLYDDLLALRPTPIVALNRAVAISHFRGTRAGLEALQAIPQRERLEKNYLLYAVEGELLARLDKRDAAIDRFREALKFSQVGPEQAYLHRMLETLASPSSKKL